MNEREARMRAGLLAIWNGARPRVMQQLDTLSRAADASANGSLSEELRHEAEREAHRLAGSVGSFGFRAATDAARELELMLNGQRPLSADRFAELVRTMRGILDTDTLP